MISLPSSLDLGRYSELRLLLLFGSRAQNEVHSLSDWDFGYIGGKDFDPDPLYTGWCYS